MKWFERLPTADRAEFCKRIDITAEALVGYANRALMDVARQYDCVVPQLDTLAWTVRHERAAPPPR